MNAIIANRTPDRTFARSHGQARPLRRRRVGQHLLAPAALEDFNRLLGRLQAAPMEQDQIASMARSLAAGPATVAPGWIASRMRHATAINLMLSDPNWEPTESAVEPACLVVGYLRNIRDLIPDQLPRLGRLDDAIVVDAAWPQLAGEVRDYLDFCRVRRIEAELRDCRDSEFAFDRQDWQQARQAEKALVRHVRKVGRSSYLSTRPSARFRVC